MKEWGMGKDRRIERERERERERESVCVCLCHILYHLACDILAGEEYTVKKITIWI